MRFTPEERIALKRFAALLRTSEGGVLKQCFDDIRQMIDHPGEEPLPVVVAMLRAAMEHERTKPTLGARKLDAALSAGYAQGRYKASKREAAKLNEGKGKL
jgi:hypothetical protein